MGGFKLKIFHAILYIQNYFKHQQYHKNEFMQYLKNEFMQSKILTY